MPLGARSADLGWPHKFTGDTKVSLTIKQRIRKLSTFKANNAWEELPDLLHIPPTVREVAGMEP
jgi:hypothetical protein